MRRVLMAVAALLALVLIGWSLRLQEKGTSRILRSGSELRVLDGRFGFAASGSQGCVLPGNSTALQFRAPVKLVVREGIGLDAEVAFAYPAPRSADASWPAGTWCGALRTRVGEIVARASRSMSIEAVLSDRRAAGRELAASLEAALNEAGVTPRELRVTLSVPDTLQQVRAVEQVRLAARSAPPLFFVGLDGADWQLLDVLMEKGAMPNLQRLVREGSHGVLETIHPPLSPLIWTTMMTGVGPLEHGILDFTRFNPFSGAREPITSDERVVPAVWNMATMGGKASGTFGLWATYPAEPVRGRIVSDRLFGFLNTRSTSGSGVVFPDASESSARSGVVAAEKSVNYAAVKQFMPSLSESEFDQHARTEDPYGHPVSALRRILQETVLYDSLALDFWSAASPDLLILYIQGTDSVGHMFAPYAPPRQSSISADDFAKYSEVPERYFRHVDTLLGRYMRLVAARRGVLMLASDHGFLWSEGRPSELSSFAATSAAKWHRDEGMYLLWGNGVQQSSERGSGVVGQVAPTILSLTGMPPSTSIRVGPLRGAPAQRIPAVDYRQYFVKPAPQKMSSTAGSPSEELSKLKALGYIGSSESGRAPTASAGSTRTAGSFNNAGLIHRREGREREAVAAFEKALTLDGKLASALWNLSDMLFASRNLDRSDELLIEALRNQLPESVKYVVGRAIGYQRSGDMRRSARLLEAAVPARPDEPELRMFRGRYRIEERNCSGALEDFTAAQRLTPGNPVPFASAGLAALCSGDEALARRFFKESLRLNPNQPQLQRFVR